MNFVFDIDGTLCFDGMSLSKEIQGILERAQIDYGHRVTFATARSYRDTIGILGDKLSLSKIIGLNGATLHENGHLVDSYYLQSDFFSTIISYCHRHQIPYFIDEVFNYATYQASKIPFIAYVDPQKRGELLEVSKIEKPIKMVLYFGDQLGRADQMLAELNRFGLSSHFFHEFEKCLYINPIAVDKGKATKKLFGNRFIAFGNDKNDISMFDAAHYSVQVGDFDELTPYANLRVSRESVHEEITMLFEKYKGIT